MRTIIKISVILSTLIMFSSCLEETFPKDSTVLESQLKKTEAELESMVNSFSVQMTSVNTAGFVSLFGWHTDFGLPSINLMTEFMLEDMATLGPNPYYNRYFQSCMNSGMGPKYAYPEYFWDCYYNWIKTANSVIATLKDNENDGVSKRYLAYAYTLRAAYYLDLARLYLPVENNYTTISDGIKGLTVPIVDENTTELDSRNNPRVPFEKMYEFILSDLEKASQNFAESNYIEKEYSKPNIHLVNGLYARAYLEMGAYGIPKGYERALEYTSKVIDESGKKPITQAEWENPITGFNSGEALKGGSDAWIWGLKVSSENIGNLMNAPAHKSCEALWGYAVISQIGISKWLYNRIPDNDFRKHSWLDPDMFEYYNYNLSGSASDQKLFLEGSNNIPPAVEYESIKFRPANGNMRDYKVGGTAEQVMMRIEEMHFIKAEALAQLNRLSEAQKVLNDFMTYRIIGEPSYDCIGKTSSKELFLQELLMQKRVEFWGEGILFYDYKRLRKGILRGYEGTNHPSVYAYNSKGVSPQLNLVITRSEIMTNDGISKEQNNPDPSGLLEIWK